MPNPKRRHSKTRTAKRRTHDALKRDRPRASARSATSRSSRTTCARTAATTAAVRRGRSRKNRTAEPGDDLDRSGRDGRRLRAAPHRGRRPGRRASFRSRRALVGPPPAIDAELARHRRRRPRSRARRRSARRHRRWRSRRPRRCGASRARRSASPRNWWREARRRRSFSAGHTGATVMAAHAAFGMLPASIDRRWRRRFRRAAGPRCCSTSAPSVECRPQHLLQFAVMGSVYARVAFGIDRAARRAAVDRRGSDARATS